MKYTIEFEEDSLNDFFDGIAYYEKISESLPDQFYNDFWRSIVRIKENPLHHQN